MLRSVLVLVLNALVGVSVANIDNWAHLGGTITGLLVGAAVVNNFNWRGNEHLYQRVAGGLAVGLLTLLTILIFTR